MNQDRKPSLPAHQPSIEVEMGTDVSATPPTPSVAPSAHQIPTLNRRTWLTLMLWRLPVVAGLVGGVWAFLKAYTVHFSKPAPAAVPTYQAIAPVNIFNGMARASQEGDDQQTRTSLPLAQAWDTATFVVAGMPAVVIRLPQAVPGSLAVPNHPTDHFLALSRVCTHQGCSLTFNRDPEAIAMGFNYRSNTPALVCPCHLSVFSVLEAGQAVSGPARFPLPRIRLEARNMHKASPAPLSPLSSNAPSNASSNWQLFATGIEDTRFDTGR